MDNDIFNNNRDNRDFMSNNQTEGRSDNRVNRQDGNSNNSMINNQTGGGSDNRDNRQDGSNNNNSMINDQTGGDKVKTIVTLPKIKESVDHVDKKIDVLDKKIDNLKVTSGDSPSLKPIEDKVDIALKRLDEIYKAFTEWMKVRNRLESCNEWIMKTADRLSIAYTEVVYDNHRRHLILGHLPEIDLNGGYYQ